MNDFSLIEKLKILMNLISSSPLFIAFAAIIIVFLLVMLVFIIINKKISKWIFLFLWISIAIVLIIMYNSIILELIDNFFDNIFMALYFPNLTIYVVILAISNFFFILSIINKKIRKSFRILNIVTSSILNLFLFLIADIVSKNKINIYEPLTVYSNSNLLVLLELSTGVFTSWILLVFLLSLYKKLKKYDKKEYPKMDEIIFDRQEIVFDE